MFEKMMSLFTGAGRDLEVARNEPSHIHIQRPGRASAFHNDTDLVAAEAGAATVEAGEVGEDTPIAVVPAA